MRVLLFSESDFQGGAEGMVLTLGQGLRSRGHEVAFLGPSNGCGWLGSEFARAGFATHRYVLRGAVDPGCVVSLSRLVRENVFDVVHSHQFAAVVYGAAACRLAGVSHVATLHGVGEQFKARRRRVALRWAFRNSSAVVAISESLRESMVKELAWPRERIQVIPNGITPRAGLRSRFRSELGIADDTKLLLAVGNMLFLKGHVTLIEALGTLAARRDWVLAIAGRHDEATADCLAAADRLGISERVHLLGARSDVPDLLAGADLFVMPSMEEGLPLALLEAMAAGKAIVATTVGGMPVALQDGAGILVAPGDAKALAAEIQELLSDRARADAASAHALPAQPGSITPPTRC